MKKTNIFLFLLILGFASVTSAQGQSIMVTSHTELINYSQGDQNYLKTLEEKYASIEGTPYQYEDFREGSLIFDKKHYTNLQLRYNIFEGIFEYKSEEETKYIDPKKAAVDTIWIGRDKFIYSEYLRGNTPDNKYMRVEYNADGLMLLASQVVQYTEPKQGNSYQGDIPGRFTRKPDVFYVRKNNEPAVELKNKNSIPEVFPDKADSMLAFIKKNKTSFKDSADLSELCEYYLSLISE